MINKKRAAIGGNESGWAHDKCASFNHKCSDIYADIQVVEDWLQQQQTPVCEQPEIGFATQPRCDVATAWSDMVAPLLKRSPLKWKRFLDGVHSYVYKNIQPDFTDDAELTRLWQRTNACPYDAVADTPGRIRIRNMFGLDRSDVREIWGKEVKPLIDGELQ